MVEARLERIQTERVRRDNIFLVTSLLDNPFGKIVLPFRAIASAFRPRKTAKER